MNRVRRARDVRELYRALRDLKARLDPLFAHRVLVIEPYEDLVPPAKGEERIRVGITRSQANRYSNSQTILSLYFTLMPGRAPKAYFTINEWCGADSASVKRPAPIIKALRQAIDDAAQKLRAKNDDVELLRAELGEA